MTAETKMLKLPQPTIDGDVSTLEAGLKELQQRHAKLAQDIAQVSSNIDLYTRLIAYAKQARDGAVEEEQP